MISEVGFLFLVVIAVVFFLVGLLARRSELLFFCTGLFVITAIMSGNVGDEIANKLFTDYLYYGYILVVMAIMSFLLSIYMVTVYE